MGTDVLRRAATCCPTESDKEIDMLKWTTMPVMTLGALLVAACGPDTRRTMEQGSTDTSRASSSQAVSQEIRPIHFRSISLTNGTWASQSLIPSSHLVMARQGSLMGRPVQDLNNVLFGTAEYLLIERDTATARYLVASANGLPDTYIAVPLSAMVITDKAIQVDSPVSEINAVPKYTFAGLQQRYAAVTLSTPVVLAPPFERVAPVTVVSNAAGPFAVVPAPGITVASPMAAPESVYLSHRHELVGRGVTDAIGSPIGQVDYVAISPASNEARYIVISGPVFGAGHNIFVPASQARLVGGRVVIDTPMATLMQTQRFRNNDLAQFHTVN
jgi:PRC-barrel domain